MRTKKHEQWQSTSNGNKAKLNRLLIGQQLITANMDIIQTYYSNMAFSSLIDYPCISSRALSACQYAGRRPSYNIPPMLKLYGDDRMTFSDGYAYALSAC